MAAVMKIKLCTCAFVLFNLCSHMSSYYTQLKYEFAAFFTLRWECYEGLSHCGFCSKLSLSELSNAGKKRPHKKRRLEQTFMPGGGFNAREASLPEVFFPVQVMCSQYTYV